MMIDDTWTPARLAGRCFLFLLRMDSTALFVILHCRLHRTTITIPSLVFHVQERPDWVCFSDAHFLPSIQRSSEPHGRAVVTTFLVLSALKDG